MMIHVGLMGDYEDRRIVGCYSSRDLAVDAVVAADPSETRDTAVVEQYELDGGEPELAS